MEQKRLEEDAFVYNWLQQQLKLSPAYKRSLIAIRTDIIMVLISLPVFQMLEVCTCMESKGKSSEPMEDPDPEFADISFEELLAQEKKDSFWLISHLFNSWLAHGSY
ncbi:6-phosphogluconate dehydrogenase, NADP-binding protein [Gossypium australe]|uniref:6-phosphogluconate dehydrogenase, NADP-binding protein n=1 Tax=Gossypium australe TaxID=47621 RepID=A0A5B6WDN1_9ROSI|nr:6-phosphogluconate dehydrogenase, NADP-binding protein [Gossypium australe]